MQRIKEIQELRETEKIQKAKNIQEIWRFIGLGFLRSQEIHKNSNVSDNSRDKRNQELRETGRIQEVKKNPEIRRINRIKCQKRLKNSRDLED